MSNNFSPISEQLPQSANGSVQAPRRLSELSGLTVNNAVSRLSSAESEVLQRINYVTPSEEKDAELALKMALVMKYVREHNLDQAVANMLMELIKRDQYPYNPHADFHRYLKIQNEKFYLFNESEETIKKYLNLPTYSTSVSYLSGVKNYNNVWGLAGIIQATNPDKLRKFDWLLSSITPSVTTIVWRKDFTSQVIIAMVGPSSFYGAFYPTVPCINFRLHYVVYGPDDVEIAISLFSESVLNDIQNMLNQRDHEVIGLYIEDDDGGYKTFESPRFQTLSHLTEENQEDIYEDLCNAARASKKISLECVFLVDPELAVYQRGQKQYDFIFLDVSLHNNKDPEGMLCFCKYPMCTIYEGVFTRKLDGEIFLGLFMDRTDLLNRDLPALGYQPSLRMDYNRNPRFGPPQVHKSEKEVRVEIDEPIELAEKLKLKREIEKKTEIKFKDEQQSRNANPEPKYQKVKKDPGHAPAYVDGIRYTNQQLKEGVVLPDSNLIRPPIEERFRSKIASLDRRTSEFYKMLHLTLLLNLMNRQTTDTAMLIAIYRILRGSGWRIHCLMQLNVSIQELVFANRGRVSHDVINRTFTKYREEFNDVLGSKMQKKPSDYTAILERCNYMFDSIYDADPPPPLIDVVPCTIKTIERLRSVNSMVEVLLIWVMENTQTSTFPNITTFFNQMADIYPEEYLIPQTPIVRRDPQGRMEPKTNWKPPEEENADVYIHGVEFKKIIDQDYMYIDVQQNIRKSNAPAVCKSESVIMQYCVNIHFDEIWHSYLVDLATLPYFPSNPWPALINTFREAALKMELLFESDKHTIDRVVDHNLGKIIDSENYLYAVHGTKAIGHRAALPVLHLEKVGEVIEYAQMFDNKQIPKRIRNFKVATCLPISGHTCFYGKLSPYLGTLELHEHIYFKGTQGCWLEALQIYCQLVWDHVRDMDSAFRVVSGVFMGHAQIRWPLETILNQPNGFKTELEYYLRKKEPVYIKAYVTDDWRYIPVKKFLKLHYVNEEETHYEIFFEEDHSYLHMNIFWLKEKAAFHFQQGGTPDRYSPDQSTNLRRAIAHVNKHIADCLKKKDFLNAYRWLTTQSLITKSENHIASTWRMLNSTVGMLEYCNNLNSSLQDLIYYAMESRYTELESPLKTVTLGKMINAYRYKLNKSLQRVGALAPRNVDEIVTERLKSTLEWDELSQLTYLRIADETLEVLREAHDMTEAVLVAVSFDINTISETSKGALYNMHIPNRMLNVSVRSEVGYPKRKVDGWQENKDFVQQPKSPAKEIRRPRASVLNKVAVKKPLDDI